MRRCRYLQLQAVLNVNDFDPKLCCAFDAKNFSETDRENSRNKEGRLFQKEWFDIFQWLAYNREIKKAFCKVCADLATDRIREETKPICK